MVVGVGDDDGVVAGHDEAVFAVPIVMEAAVGSHVAVVIRYNGPRSLAFYGNHQKQNITNHLLPPLYNKS